MEYQLRFNVNDKIYLKDPESSELGKEIVKQSIDLIYELGFESFTFKKLATRMHTTEATIYRYFVNKHRLLLYILNWYWLYLEFLVVTELEGIKDTGKQLKCIVDLLTHEFPDSSSKLEYNKKFLHQIVIAESSKVYLVKEINEINKDQVFKPYKDLCMRIANVIKEYKPGYKYPRSLSTTLIETAHQQEYFSHHLPRLTDNNQKKSPEFATQFVSDLLFKTLD